MIYKCNLDVEFQKSVEIKGQSPIRTLGWEVIQEKFKLEVLPALR